MTLNRLLAAVVILSIFVLAAFFWLSRPATVGAEEIFARVLPSRLVTRGEPLKVTLAFDDDPLPVCSVTSAQPTEIMLVLDQSGSMQGEALAQTERAVESLIQQLDLEYQRVGLVLFDETAMVATPLTTAASQVVDGLRLSMGGGNTAIHVGIEEARRHLGTANSGARKIMLLLSDGGSNLDAARQAGESARAEGVEIIAVAVRGEEFKPDVLKAVTGSQASVIPLDHLGELQDLFVRLGEAIASQQGSNVKLIETINRDAFTLVESDLVDQNGSPELSWSSAFLPTTGHGPSYVLRAESYGWHTVSPQPTSGELIACDQATISFNTPEGPAVLVTPPLLWLVVPWLLLIGGLMFAFIKKLLFGEGQDQGPKPLEPNYDQFPTTAPPLLLPEGLFALKAPDDLEETKSAQPFGDPGAIQPHLIMATGPQGRWVLTELKRRLVQRYGEMPASVRLLLVDFVARRHSRSAQSLVLDGVELNNEELLILQPKFNEIVSNLKGSTGKELAPWWGTRTIDQPSRARARLAVAYDVGMGKESIAKSRLIQQLIARKRGLENYVQIGIGFLGDETGAMLFDLMELAKVANQAISPSQRVLLLGMPDVVEIKNRNEKERATEWMGGTLYEYERLMRNQNWHSVYGVSDHSPFDACYLFSGFLAELESEKVEADPSVDLSARQISAGAVAALVAWLDTHLDSLATRAIQQQIQQESTRVSGQVSALKKPLIGAIGACELQIPVEELTKIAQSQFVSNLVKCWQVATPTDGANRQSDIKPFLEGDLTQQHHPFLKELASPKIWQDFIADNTFQARFFHVAFERVGNAFTQMFHEFAFNELKKYPGREGEALAQIAYFARDLSVYLRQLGQYTAKGSNLPQDERRPILSWIQEQHRFLQAVTTHVSEWQTMLIALGDWGQQQEQEAEKAWHGFLQSRGGMLTKEILDLDQLRNEVEVQITRTVDAVSQKRAFWLWSPIAPQATLLLPPLEADGETLKQQHVERVVAELGFGSQQQSALLGRLQEWATYHSAFVKSGAQFKLSPLLKEVDQDRLVRPLAIESNFLLEYNRTKAITILNPENREGQGALVYRTYTLADSQLAASVAQKITETGHHTPGSHDPFRLGVALTMAPIPLETISQYEQVVKESGVSEREQVFVAEQHARLWEAELRKAIKNDPLGMLTDEEGELRPDLPISDPSLTFHQAFRAQLKNPEQAELFARALLFDIIKVESGQAKLILQQPQSIFGHVRGLEGIASAFFASKPSRNASLSDPFSSLHYRDTIRQIRRAVKKKKEEAGYGLELQLKERFERSDIQELTRGTLFEKNLWLFLFAVANIEVNG